MATNYSHEKVTPLLYFYLLISNLRIIILIKRILEKAVGKKSIDKGFTCFAKSTGALISFFLLLQSSVLLVNGAGPTDRLRFQVPRWSGRPRSIQQPSRCRRSRNDHLPVVPRWIPINSTIKDGQEGVDGLDFAFKVTLSLDGKHAYVAAYNDDAVSWYERNASTGALTFGGVLKDGVNGVDGLDGARA